VVSWVMLWPVLLGQWLSAKHYARGCDKWNRLTDRVWIGRRLNEAEAERAIAEGVSAVLDLTGEMSEPRPFLETRYFNLAVMDLTAPSSNQLDLAVQFIEEQSREGVVYIHCKAGYSRTAAVAGAWLIESGQALNSTDAIRQLCAARPGMIIRPEARLAIESFEKRAKSRTPVPVMAEATAQTS
jgi:predicted protein tyrosine phosphatase